MRTVTFRGGPIDGHTQMISDDDQQTFSSFVSHKDWVAEHIYYESATDLKVFEHSKGAYRFIVENDQPDEDGTVINIEGVEVNDPVYLMMGFSSHIRDVITICKVWSVPGYLMCEAMLEGKHLDFNPAISFRIIKWENRESGKFYDVIKIYTVGLIVAPLFKIKTIREQIKEQG